MAEKTITSASELGAMQREDKDPPKVSKITQKDWQKVEAWLKDELQNRKQSEFRRNAESRWREIDRQVAMNPMTKVDRNGQDVDAGWHSVIEIGELSRASENLSADVRRICFPQNRYWFEAHSDIQDQLKLDQVTGRPKKDTKLQEKVDGRVKALMSQQHNDFKLQDRVELSIKEAIHHGTMVVEIDWEEQEFVYEGTKVRRKESACWEPISTWNAFLDPSPSVIGGGMFYEGSLFVERYKPRHQCELMVKESGEGWMPSQWKKVNKDMHKIRETDQTKDVKIVTYWGDIYIDRADETLYYPNHKAVTMNGTIVYFAPNKTPYLPIIVQHYERMDVRDPYGTSPIVKMSAFQKLGSQLANKTIDGVELALEPPIVYDGNDPDFVINGGPDVSPGSKTSTKGAASFKVIEIGDPRVAIEGLQLVLGEMKENLGRPGAPVGDRATKAEVVKSSQDQEVSLVNFITKMEVSLRSFLFMQHAFNLRKLKEYSFYSPEVEDPDFIVIKKSDLPKDVNFEVVGARGVLGEQERGQKLSIVSAFAAGNPLFAPLLDAKEILIQMLQDAGIKNPERFLVNAGEENVGALKAENQKLKMVLQKLGPMLQEEKQKSAVKMAKIQSDHQTKLQKITNEHQDKQAKMMLEHKDNVAKLHADVTKHVTGLRADLASEVRQLLSEHALQNKQHAHEVDKELIHIHMPGGDKSVKKEGGNYEISDKETAAIMKDIKGVLSDHIKSVEAQMKPRKRRVKRVSDGNYEVTEE